MTRLFAWLSDGHNLRGVCVTPAQTGLRPIYVRGNGSRGVFGDS